MQELLVFPYAIVCVIIFIRNIVYWERIFEILKPIICCMYYYDFFFIL